MGLPDFTRLLEITGPKALGLLIAGVALHVANAFGWVTLLDIHPGAVAIVDVITAVAGALALMWIAETIVNSIRGTFRARARKRAKEAEANSEGCCTASYQNFAILLVPRQAQEH